MWSEQQQSADHVVSGNPNFNNSSAAALLSYDVAHSIPWDWRVSLYTWTKGIASGCLFRRGVAGAVWISTSRTVRSGYGSRRSSPARFWRSPAGCLLWDFEHPTRFYMIFTRPQWRSWLVKGAFIIAGYSLVLALHFVASCFGSADGARLVDDSRAFRCRS